MFGISCYSRAQKKRLWGIDVKIKTFKTSRISNFKTNFAKEKKFRYFIIDDTGNGE